MLPKGFKPLGINVSRTSEVTEISGLGTHTKRLAKYTKSDKISQTEIGTSGSLKIELSDSVLKLTINRPEARNAMTLEVMELLSFGMDVAYTNSAVKVVVIQGEGEKAFCAGADLGGNSMMNSSGDSQMIFQHEAKGY